jgi:hypothetical protein
MAVSGFGERIERIAVNGFGERIERIRQDAAWWLGEALRVGSGGNGWLSTDSGNGLPKARPSAHSSWQLIGCLLFVARWHRNVEAGTEPVTSGGVTGAEAFLRRLICRFILLVL